jgi:hypothetical protein
VLRFEPGDAAQASGLICTLDLDAEDDNLVTFFLSFALEIFEHPCSHIALQRSAKAQTGAVISHDFATNDLQPSG